MVTATSWDGPPGPTEPGLDDAPRSLLDVPQGSELSLEPLVDG